MESLDTGTEQVLASRDAGVGTITLNRPEARNALSPELSAGVRRMLDFFEADPETRVVVVNATGTAFCAGGDIKGMGGRKTPDDTKSENKPDPIQNRVRALEQRIEAFTFRFYELSKPTIASLPGPAAGAGLAFALAADLRIASESAFVTTAFGNMGFSGDNGASWTLVQLVGLARAKELFYTSRRVQPEEALRLGIFNDVVPAAELESKTVELARTIANGPPIALRYMKENLNRAVDTDFRTCLAMEADRMVRTSMSEDHKEAVSAFMEKRKPEFKGR